MFKKFLVAAVAALTVLFVPAAGATTFNPDPARTVYFVGPIGGEAIFAAAKIEALSKASSDPIYLVLNSPGGAVLGGLQVISSMRVAQNRGVTFKCFVPMIAASMAFQIFANCDERYTLRYSLLLWHPMRAQFLMAALTSEELEYEGKQMRAWELPMIADLIRVLGIPRKTFYYHYKHETLFTAEQLGGLAPSFLTIVDGFENINRPFVQDGEAEGPAPSEGRRKVK